MYTVRLVCFSGCAAIRAGNSMTNRAYGHHHWQPPSSGGGGGGSGHRRGTASSRKPYLGWLGYQKHIFLFDVLSFFFPSLENDVTQYLPSILLSVMECLALVLSVSEAGSF